MTRQEVLHFGAPIAWETPPVPAWVDYDAAFYGVGDLDGRGVKVCPDREGPEFDPDRDDRTPTARGRGRRARLPRPPLPGARGRAARLLTRLPVLAHRATRTSSIARHPEEERVWLLGGGSGHGFKHGPALGEYVAGLLESGAEPDARFGLGERGPGTSLRTAGTGSRRSRLGDPERALHVERVRVADVPVRALLQRHRPRLLRRALERDRRGLVHARGP